MPADRTALYVTITRKGQTRYAYWPARSFRSLPMPRAEAEGLLAEGKAAIVEIRDYLNGDGSAQRVREIDASAAH